MEDNTLAKISQRRYRLSIIIIVFSLILLFITFYCVSPRQWETAFTAIIGLVGTWVGTVLAFYFSKENFDAASASTQKLVDSITSKEKLSSMNAKGAMIPISEINFMKIEEGKTLSNYKLTELKDKFLTKYNRLPILKHDGTIYCITHKSLIVEFIAEQAIAGKKPEELTLKDLLDNPTYNEKAMKGFTTIKGDDSLIIAKTLMERLSTGNIICSDIFVTEDGTSKTKVTGWLTNIEITKNSIV